MWVSLVEGTMLILYSANESRSSVLHAPDQFELSYS